MQKRPFILLEVLLSIALLSMALVPLIGSPFLLFQKQRDSLIKLAYQRDAPVIFYTIVKELKTNHPKWDFPKLAPAKQPKYRHPLDIEINVKGLQTIKKKIHYHLYHNHKDPKKRPLDKKNVLLLYCFLCFEDRCTCDEKPAAKEAFQIVIKRAPS